MRGEGATPAETGPEADLHFEMGGPAYIMQRIGLIKGAGPSVARRSVCFAAVTWLPMPVLATAEGNAIGASPRSSLPLDYATYARLFVAVPLIFAAEAVVGPRLRAAGLRFTRAGIIRSASIKEFGAAVARVRRRWEAALRVLPPRPGRYHRVLRGREERDDPEEAEELAACT